ncbi:hypothetical protein AAF712_011209 [Marasmius tenuissimus]|uniref:Uncharacterized protein n=1 Tax=Marasmius tenuissimus TaxID=585030 RepID=A0ABR2ZL09_9AGAR|nr:hypothetical protein PM082_016055 [Marasmius tenuissimus]
MIVITSLTVGEITFILRAIIQIFSYGGLFLLGYIVYASTPQIASLKTHDVLNRVVGKGTATKETIKWIFSSLRGRTGDPVVAKRLVISLSLLTIYSLLVALSDIGFLGFHTCNVSGGTFYDYPMSVHDSDSARSALNAALVNGSDPNIIKISRCDATQTEDKGDFTLQVCTSWHNTTLGDPHAFAGINNTDSDMLLPRFLRHSNHTQAATFDLNIYRVLPLPQLVTTPVIMNGLVAEPRDSGVRVVFGVPNLNPGHSAGLQKSMAMEVEVGCMSLGMFSSHIDGAPLGGIDYFATEPDKQKYSGPEILRDVLHQTVNEVRDYYSPFYKPEASDGFRLGINKSSASFSDVPTIKPSYLPTRDGSLSSAEVQRWMMGNCTERMRKKLGLDQTEYMTSNSDKYSSMCNLFAVTGPSSTDDGDYIYLSTKILCASSTQVNMVSGTAMKDRQGAVTLNVTRLPSDLHQVRADYFDIVHNGENTTFPIMDPVLRYTLSDNPDGQTSHYIYQNANFMDIPNRGTGSPGNAISRIGTIIMDIGRLTTTDFNYVQVLNDQNFTTDPKTVTRWAGRFGASLALNSLVYNGYVAQDAQPILVTDLDGKVATCYRTPYAISFLPLVLAAIVIIAWIVMLLVGHGLDGTKQLEELYGGLRPYWGVVCPTTAAQSAILSWENHPGPHLALVPPHHPISENESTGTAARQLSRVPDPLSPLPSKSSYA